MITTPPITPQANIPQAGLPNTPHLITSIDNNLLSIAINEILKGQIIRHDQTTKRFTLATFFGNITLESPLPLKAGDQLELKITNNHHKFTAEITQHTPQTKTSHIPSAPTANSTETKQTPHQSIHTDIPPTKPTPPPTTSKNTPSPIKSNIITLSQEVTITPHHTTTTNTSATNITLNTAPPLPQNHITGTLVQTTPKQVTQFITQHQQNPIIQNSNITAHTTLPPNTQITLSIPQSPQITAPEIRTQQHQSASTTSQPHTKTVPTTLTPPSTSTPTTATTNIPLSATITHTTQQHTTLKTAIGTLTIPHTQLKNIKLPPNHPLTPTHTPSPTTTNPTPPTITLTLESITIPTSNTSSPTSQSIPNTTPLTTLLSHWPALEETITILYQQQSLTSLQQLAQHIPTTQQPLAPKLLHFIANLKGGSVEQWLDTNTNQILTKSSTQKQQTLFDTLKADFVQLNKLATEESPTKPWQLILFPLFDSNHLHQIPFYYRHQKKNDTNTKTKQTRFIIELEQSELGPLQLDGLTEATEQHTQLDLIVRTQTPLPSALQNGIIEIFTNTQELTNLQGTLTFQTQTPFTTNPRAELLTTTPI